MSFIRRPAITPTELYCGRCQLMKPDAEFQANAASHKRRLRFHWCRACVKSYNADYRARAKLKVAA